MYAGSLSTSLPQKVPSSTMQQDEQEATPTVSTFTGMMTSLQPSAVSNAASQAYHSQHTESARQYHPLHRCCSDSGGNSNRCCDNHCSSDGYLHLEKKKQQKSSKF